MWPVALVLKRACQRNTSNASSRDRPRSCRFIGGQSGGTVLDAIMDGAIVVTVAVKAAGKDPFGVTEAGTTVQVANEGAPVHVRATVPAKPFRAEICKV